MIPEVQFVVCAVPILGRNIEGQAGTQAEEKRPMSSSGFMPKCPVLCENNFKFSKANS